MGIQRQSFTDAQVVRALSVTFNEMPLVANMTKVKLTYLNNRLHVEWQDAPPDIKPVSRNSKG
jgi:hypothetical protein